MLNTAYVLLGAAFMFGALHIWRHFTIPKSDRCPHCSSAIYVVAATETDWIVSCSRCDYQAARSHL